MRCQRMRAAAAGRTRGFPRWAVHCGDRAASSFCCLSFALRVGACFPQHAAIRRQARCADSAILTRHQPLLLAPNLQHRTASGKMAAFVTVAPVDAFFGCCRLSKGVSGAARAVCDCQSGFALGGLRAPASANDEAPAPVRARVRALCAARRTVAQARARSARAQAEQTCERSNCPAAPPRASALGPVLRAFSLLGGMDRAAACPCGCLLALERGRVKPS
jgi:hypothetical protein